MNAYFAGTAVRFMGDVACRHGGDGGGRMARLLAFIHFEQISANALHRHLAKEA